MPLDGLRAWIGEVERKLGIRTRVFLVLSVIAIGAAGAAIYLAVDAHNKTVNESDLQALQRQLEGQISGGGTGGSASVAQLESEVAELKQQVEKLTGEEGGAGAKKGGAEGAGSEGTGAEGGSGAGGSGGGKESGASNEAGTTLPQPTTSPPATSSEGAASAKLKELIEKAKANGH